MRGRVSKEGFEAGVGGSGEVARDKDESLFYEMRRRGRASYGYLMGTVVLLMVRQDSSLFFGIFGCVFIGNGVE